MKSLSAYNATAIDNPYVDPVNLLKIEFSGLTLYLCDRVWGDAGSEMVFDGNLYEPLVISWGTVEQGKIDPVTYEVEPGSMQVVVDNNTPVGGADQFTALFASYDPHYVPVTISHLFVGASNEIDIFKGQIEDILNMLTDQVTLVFSGFELDIANKFSHTIVNTDDYSGAEEDDIGKMFPEVWGTAKKVPFMKVASSGGVATFIIGHAIKVFDAVYFEQIEQSSGFVTYTGQAGDQHPTYGAKAAITFTILDKPFPVALEAVTMPLGYPKSLDRNGYILDYDTATTITFQSAPAGNLEDIYVEYDFELREFGAPTQTMQFFIDGVLIALWDGSSLIQFTTSPLRVKKSSWPATATKTASWRADGHQGVTLTILSAIVHARSDINDAGPNGRGHQENRESTNQPLGKITSTTAVDAGTSLTWDAAPAGTLSDIEITYSWDYQFTGDPIFSGRPHHHSIDGFNVIWIDIDGSTTQLLPSTFTVRESSWQTSIIKTQSRLDQYLRGEAFIIRSATQTAYTDLVDDNVQVSGDTIDDLIFRRRVSADIQGYQDDGSGTYTGTPAALIEQPDHILRHLLIVKCGLSASEWDSITYDASGTYYAAQSFTLGVVVLQKPNVRMLINRIAHQSKSLEFWEAGVHHLIAITGDETIDKTFDENRIDLNQIWIKYTDRINIKNSLSARYARDWSGYSDNVDATADTEADRSVVVSSDADSITKYGTLEGEQLALPYITGATMAQAILDWIKGDWANPRIVVEFAGGYYGEDVERGDIIGFGLGTDAERIFVDTDARSWESRDEREWHKILLVSKLKAATSGLITGGHRFRVIDKPYRPDATQQIQAVQI